jgi:nicotinate-nucleotide adenylyltransferase
VGGRVGIAESTAGERWGILGGIFDPIHYGHLTIAEQARDALGLDRVLFVPAGQPVHRDPPIANAEHRAHMVSLAISGNPFFELSRVEIDAERPSYTVDTLVALADQNPAHDWALIASAEAARALPTWRSPERILDLARIAVVARLGHPDLTPEWLAQSFPGREDRFELLSGSRLGHSSSDIRERLGHGRSIRYLVPAAVQTYIEDNRLYGPH